MVFPLKVKEMVHTPKMTSDRDDLSASLQKTNEWSYIRFHWIPLKVKEMVHTPKTTSDKDDLSTEDNLSTKDK